MRNSIFTKKQIKAAEKVAVTQVIEHSVFQLEINGNKILIPVIRGTDGTNQCDLTTIKGLSAKQRVLISDKIDAVLRNATIYSSADNFFNEALQENENYCQKPHELAPRNYKRLEQIINELPKQAQIFYQGFLHHSKHTSQQWNECFSRLIDELQQQLS